MVQRVDGRLKIRVRVIGERKKNCFEMYLILEIKNSNSGKGL